MKIKDIKARQIFDSRGIPTIATRIELDSGKSAEAMVPSGASTGSFEAVELRDDNNEAYLAKGVKQAIDNVNQIIRPALLGKESSQQQELDQIMIALDGSANKSKLGANAILSVSLALAKVSALTLSLPLYHYLSRFNPNFDGTYILPRPMLNIINGGAHANFASDFQEYMIIPLGVSSLADILRQSSEVYQTLKAVLAERKLSTLVGDEGGFSPAVKTNQEPLELIDLAIRRAKYQSGKDFVFALDIAATEFYQDKNYQLKLENRNLSASELGEYYQELIKAYPLYSLEDPFAEEDWDSYANFTQANQSIQVVGDDLYVTNQKRLEQGIALGSTNSILIKPNQIGTLTETMAVINLAQSKGFSCVISHRSGETEDTFIADLAVAFSTGQIKTGSLARSERLAKYNRLLAIEAELGDSAKLITWPFT